MKKTKVYTTIVHLLLVLMALSCLIPLMMVLSVSFSRQSDVLTYGYRLIPMHFDVTAYKILFKNTGPVLKAYGVTAYYAVVNTVLSLLICSMAGYAMSRSNFKMRKFFNYFFLLTMLIGGGTIPSYILKSKYLGLSNNLLLYAVNALVAAYTIFVFRTFFAQIPTSLIEAATIDGAKERQIFVKVIFPMSVPVFASMGFTMLIEKWNDYIVPLYYMTNKNYYTIQYYLQLVLNDLNFIKQSLRLSGAQTLATDDMPLEILKFSLCVVGALPALIAFPFFQKYFSIGMVLGSVKG